jgi:uncharacterized membrane protein (DUF106 family)
MGLFDFILNPLIEPLKAYNHVPESALIVAAGSLLLSIVSMSANRFLVDYKMMANNRKEFSQWSQAVRKARKEGDEKQLEKLMRRQSAVMKMQSRATLEQFKTYPVTLVPFYVIYYALAGAFTANGGIIAYAPFLFPFASATMSGEASQLSLFFWYLVCSLAISVPLARIFGVSSAFQMNPSGGDTTK